VNTIGAFGGAAGFAAAGADFWELFEACGSALQPTVVAMMSPIVAAMLEMTLFIHPAV
jgi:preprotein translocase subunit Sec61beta